MFTGTKVWGFFRVDIPTPTTHSTSPPTHPRCHQALGLVPSDFPDPGVNLIQDLLVLKKMAAPPWYAGTLSPKRMAWLEAHIKL